MQSNDSAGFQASLKFCATPRAVTVLIEEESERQPIGATMLNAALLRLSELHSNHKTIENFCGALGLKCGSMQKINARMIRLIAGEIDNNIQWYHEVRLCIQFERPPPLGLARYFAQHDQCRIMAYFDQENRLVNWSVSAQENSAHK